MLLSAGAAGQEHQDRSESQSGGAQRRLGQKWAVCVLTKLTTRTAPLHRQPLPPLPRNA